MHRQAGAATGTGAGSLRKQAMDHMMTDYGSSVPVLRQSDRGIVTLPFRHGLSTCTRQSGRLAKRVSADSTDTAKKRLADQEGSSRAPGILFPTGREQEYRCLGTRVPAAGNRSTSRQRAEKVLTIQTPESASEAHQVSDSQGQASFVCPSAGHLPLYLAHFLLLPKFNTESGPFPDL